MRVDHGRLDFFVTERFLNGPNVVPMFAQMRGEGIPESMVGAALGYQRTRSRCERAGLVRRSRTAGWRDGGSGEPRGVG
jgi:hypothetical protein